MARVQYIDLEYDQSDELAIVGTVTLDNGSHPDLTKESTQFEFAVGIGYGQRVVLSKSKGDSGVELFENGAYKITPQSADTRNLTPGFPYTMRVRWSDDENLRQTIMRGTFVVIGTVLA
jgi:hypothetical protein